jgi:hypothetical protein
MQTYLPKVINKFAFATFKIKKLSTQLIDNQIVVVLFVVFQQTLTIVLIICSLIYSNLRKKALRVLSELLNLLYVN